MDTLEALQLLSLTKEQLVSLGASVEFDPDEAEALGAFEEDALTAEDVINERMN